MLLEFLLLRILTFTVTVTPFVQQTRITIIYQMCMCSDRTNLSNQMMTKSFKQNGSGTHSKRDTMLRQGIKRGEDKHDEWQMNSEPILVIALCLLHGFLALFFFILQVVLQLLCSVQVLHTFGSNALFCLVTVSLIWIDKQFNILQIV